MSVLTEAAVFLGAAVLAVPVAKRLGLGSVLGYLAAGAAIGPWALGLVTDVDSILHFAEFGIVLLLFLIGLELQPSRLWTMRKPVFGLGGAQVVLSTVAIGGVAYALGQPLAAAFAIGGALSLSSTAFALQIMAEKGHLTTRYGRSAFSILLFQDIAAIPIIAAIPLLAGGPDVTGPDVWIDALTVAGVIVAVIAIGRFVLRYALRAVAASGIREIFTAFSLLTVIGTALLMESVGLSMALGAFLAGVLLADSEYRHAIEADIEPFKGLLLGLFFIAVGMSVNFGLLASEILTVIALVAALIGIKAAVLWLLGFPGGLDRSGRRNLAIALCQGGEFAFVILGIAVANRVVDQAAVDMVILVVTLSMAVTPFMFLAAGWLEKPAAVDDREADEILPEDKDHQVIIAGFGRFGQMIGRMLRAKRISFTALERDPNQVNFVAKFGNKVYYGDTSRPDVMRAAGADEATVLVVAVDGEDHSVTTVQMARARFAHLKIIARAKDRNHAYRLMEAGADEVVRETFLSGVEAGRLTLQSIGFEAKEAQYIAETFRDHDERRLRQQYGNHTDEAAYREETQQWARELEEIFADEKKVSETTDEKA